MKTLKTVVIGALLVIAFSVEVVMAQTPLWQGKGRIAISSDGNEHDHWAATPLTLALLTASGLQDRLVIYTYSDHVWGSNQDHPTSASGLNAYEHMRESALGGQERFGFDSTKFVCAVDNDVVAYNALRDVINESTAENPLILIAVGPMQAVGEAINRSDVSKRQYVTLISYSNWNNSHSDKPHESAYWDDHSEWTFQEIKDEFSGDEGGNLTCLRISDQYGRQGYEGLKAPKEKFDWVKTSPARDNEIYKPGSWDWLYSRLETCIKKGDIDASDAGMVLFMLTGIENTDLEMAKEILENPIMK